MAKARVIASHSGSCSRWRGRESGVVSEFEGIVMSCRKSRLGMHLSRARNWVVRFVIPGGVSTDSVSCWGRWKDAGRAARAASVLIEGCGLEGGF
jgi:hypothetical protein